MSLGLAAPGHSVSDVGFEIAEGVFFTIYIVDVLVRIIVLRREWYYDDQEGIMFMNIFDALLVLVHAFELMLLPLPTPQ